MHSNIIHAQQIDESDSIAIFEAVLHEKLFLILLFYSWQLQRKTIRQ